MNEKKTQYTTCYVYVLEEDSRVSVNTIVVDFQGNTLSKNNWTFDILSLELFQTILKQILRVDMNIKKLFIAIPGVHDGKSFITTDFFEVDSRSIEKSWLTSGIEISFINDVDTAIKGYFSENIQEVKGKRLAALYLPKNYPPGAGFIIGDIKIPGEVKWLYPNTDWENLYNTKKKERIEIIANLCRGIIGMMSPDILVIYSEYLQKEDIDQIKNTILNEDEITFPIVIVLKNNMINDLERGILNAEAKS